MASQWTFGNIGRTVAAGGDGLELSGHYVMDFAGDECTIEADLDQDRALFASDAATIAAQRALREQFRGYDLSEDEKILSLTSVQDPTVDAFYRVQSIEVVDTAGTHFAGGIGSHVTIELLRVGQAPLFELVCSGADRQTAHVITEWSWAGLPGTDYTSAEDVTTSPATVLGFSVDKGGSSNSALYLPDAAVKNGFYENSLLYVISAANYYRACAKIEASADGGVTWRTVTGRQIANVTDLGWRIGNGLIRLYSDASGGGVGNKPFVLQVNDAGNWETLSFNLGYRAGGVFVAWGITSVIVLRNSPEAVTVRLVVSPAGLWQNLVDLTIRRGSWVLEGVQSSRTATQFAVQGQNAGSAVTGGIDLTTAVSGNKSQFRSPSAITTVAATNPLLVYLTAAATSMPFGIGVDTFEGNGTTTGPSTSGLYFAAMNHRQLIVAA